MVLRNVSWILVSLFIHAALGASLWILHPEASHIVSEEIVDLTLAAPSGSNDKIVTMKPKGPLAKPSHAVSVSSDNTAPKSASPMEANSTSASDSTEGGDAAPVGWGEVTRFPKVTKEVKASYPLEAKKAGVDGPVVLDILVDRLGKVRDVQIVSGPGYGLNESAIEALKQFEFHPAQKGSDPVAVKIRYTYRFKLGVN